MIVIPMLLNTGRVDLLIVLAEENLERIRRYDPAELKWHELPEAYRGRLPATLAITFATAAELQQIEGLVTEGKTEEALKLVTRGFEYRPDLGDHDRGPERMG